MKENFWNSVWAGEILYNGKNNTKELPWEAYTWDKNLEELISQINTKEYNILELGCGSGYDTLFLSKISKSITAIDISEIAINIAKKNNIERNNITFIVGDISTDIPNKEYDLVYDKGCLHNNIEEASSLFINLHQLLSKNGKIIIITGNKNNKGSLYTRPPGVDISTIEAASKGLFNIKLVKEIMIEQNKDYEDALGWIFVLEKR